MLWTGLCLYFPALAEIMNRPLATKWHLYSAIALGVGLVVLVAAKPRDFGRIVREVDTLDENDRAWLRGGPRRLIDHEGAPEQGWWNAGQKMFTAVTLGLMVVLAVTGVLLWLGERNTAFRFGGTVDVHDLATILIVILTSGHLYLALLHPATRAATRGIVTGEVDREWAQKNHARWIRDLDPPGP
jgi:formate dehydrogenase subunit gamma